MRRLLRQKTTNELYVWTEELAARPDMELFIHSHPDSSDHTRADIRQIESDVIRFYLSANGLGDAVTGLYAACGASDGRPVEYYTLHPEWLLAEHPGVKILKGNAGIDANANYLRQERECVEEGTRVGWYLQNLSKAYGLHDPFGCRPKYVQTVESPLRASYAVLAPFAHSSSRCWLPAHYRRLAIMLLKQLPVVVISDRRDAQRAEEIFYGLKVSHFAGSDARTVIGLIAGADFLVCNDSGPAHLGGLYGKRTVSLCAHYRGDYSFECANNIHVLSPRSSCVYCHAQDARGWDQYCLTSCSALQTLMPEEVFEFVRGL